MPNRSIGEKLKKKNADVGIDNQEIQHRQFKPTAETIARVSRAAKMISKGQPRSDVMDMLENDYNLSHEQARRYYVAATRYLLPKDPEKYREGLIQANIERLEKVIDEGLKSKNYKLVRDTIETLNKMLMGGQSIQVGVKNNPDDNTSEFIIKINE